MQTVPVTRHEGLYSLEYTEDTVPGNGDIIRFFPYPAAGSYFSRLARFGKAHPQSRPSRFWFTLSVLHLRLVPEPRGFHNCSSGVQWPLAGRILAGRSDVGRCDATPD